MVRLHGDDASEHVISVFRRLFHRFTAIVEEGAYLTAQANDDPLFPGHPASLSGNYEKTCVALRDGITNCLRWFGNYYASADTRSQAVKDGCTQFWPNDNVFPSGHHPGDTITLHDTFEQTLSSLLAGRLGNSPVPEGHIQAAWTLEAHLIVMALLTFVVDSPAKFRHMSAEDRTKAILHVLPIVFGAEDFAMAPELHEGWPTVHRSYVLSPEWNRQLGTSIIEQRFQTRVKDNIISTITWANMGLLTPEKIAASVAAEELKRSRAQPPAPSDPARGSGSGQAKGSAPSVSAKGKAKGKAKDKGKGKQPADWDDDPRDPAKGKSKGKGKGKDKGKGKGKRD